MPGPSSITDDHHHGPIAMPVDHHPGPGMAAGIFGQGAQGLGQVVGIGGHRQAGRGCGSASRCRRNRRPAAPPGPRARPLRRHRRWPMTPWRDSRARVSSRSTCRRMVVAISSIARARDMVSGLVQPARLAQQRLQRRLQPMGQIAGPHCGRGRCPLRVPQAARRPRPPAAAPRPAERRRCAALRPERTAATRALTAASGLSPTVTCAQPARISTTARSAV